MEAASNEAAPLPPLRSMIKRRRGSGHNDKAGALIMIVAGGPRAAEGRSLLAEPGAAPLRCQRCGEPETLLHRYWQCGWLYQPGAPPQVAATNQRRSQAEAVAAAGEAFGSEAWRQPHGGGHPRR